MDYEVMLDFHKANNAEVTIAVMPVPIEEASRFGIMIAERTIVSPSLKRNRNIPEAILQVWVFTYSTGRH